MHNHQDWEPVVIRNPKVVAVAAKRTGKHSIEAKHGGGKNINTFQPSNARKIESEENTGAPVTVTHDLKMKIQQARMAKKWTQKELATHTNIRQTTIQTYENGTAVPNSRDLGIIGKVLGVQLSNKTKKSVPKKGPV